MNVLLLSFSCLNRKASAAERARALLLQEHHHGLAHHLADVHVGQGVAAVVAAARARAVFERVRVDGRDVALEVRVLRQQVCDGGRH